ncbi:MAG TPA: adenosylcobinamide-phosphate synthase CbiB [Ottowia sp.]|nr:adenosylcobinamide-phosphate synthase CbiB [Ottowia sp.]
MLSATALAWPFAAALALAWALDARFGEPRDAWHPVAWFGRVAAPCGRRLLSLPPRWALMAGAVLWAAGVGLVAALGAWLQSTFVDAPLWLGVPLLALALKPSFAWRMLRDEVQGVEVALQHGLATGRQRLARLCSRDVAQLDEAGVRETAIETLAENFNDSLVAPLFWFAVAGLPGAWAWRAANTLDAMWGYRGRWEWAGKWAARADDVLGWLPARIAAALLWRPAIALGTLCTEARRTPSPNGGWPMAAMALRLGVRLGKPGVYVLNAGGQAPDAAALQHALRIAEQAARTAFLLVIGLTFLFAFTGHAGWRGTHP